MSSKGYKTRDPIGSTIDKEIHKRLLQYHEETKIPMSRIYDMAIDQYLNSVTKEDQKKI